MNQSKNKEVIIEEGKDPREYDIKLLANNKIRLLELETRKDKDFNRIKSGFYSTIDIPMRKMINGNISDWYFVFNRDGNEFYLIWMDIIRKHFKDRDIITKTISDPSIMDGEEFEDSFVMVSTRKFRHFKFTVENKKVICEEV